MAAAVTVPIVPTILLRAAGNRVRCASALRSTTPFSHDQEHTSGRAMGSRVPEAQSRTRFPPVILLGMPFPADQALDYSYSVQFVTLITLFT
jgi:hypothetical protein